MSKGKPSLKLDSTHLPQKAVMKRTTEVSGLTGRVVVAADDGFIRFSIYDTEAETAHQP